MSELSRIEMEALDAQKRAALIQVNNSLTKREQIAIAMMQGMLAGNTTRMIGTLGILNDAIADQSIKVAFAIADTMLEVSKQGDKQ